VPLAEVCWAPNSGFTYWWWYTCRKRNERNQIVR